MLRVLALVIMLALMVGQATANEDFRTLVKRIDQHIQARLDRESIKRASIADDAEFLRRVTIDLHGVVPTPQRVVHFLDSREVDKRAELIEELLSSPRFGEHLGDVWRGYLLSPQVNEQRTQSDRFADWLTARFIRNDGWDRIVTELLTATGKMEDNPAVTYLIEGRHPLSVTDLTDLSSRYFLGIRLNCVQCHNHPFANWKQRDYWGMAAFFAQIQTPDRPKQVYVKGVQDDNRLTLTTLRDADVLEGYQPQPPTFLGGDMWNETVDTTHRGALARWITSRDNPYFARAMVNRMWWHFFGRGIVNPVDDMHAGNAPSHPELLDLLSQQFAASGFDVKLLCRAIVNTQTYQQTSRPREHPDQAAESRETDLFARISVKVLTPQQLYDSLTGILGSPSKSKGIDTRLGTRYEFNQFFAGDGDPDPTRYDRGIPHVLRLMNSPQFAGRNLDALVSRLTSNGRSTDEVLDDMFLHILARRPTSIDRQLAYDHLKTTVSPEIAYRQLAWALLVSSEFMLNH